MNSAARIETFLEMMSAERGAAENTLSSYRRDLEDASEFLGKQPGGLAQAGASGIRAYLDDIASRGFATTSQARKLSSLRQFFKFLYAEGLRPDDLRQVTAAPRRYGWHATLRAPFSLADGAQWLQLHHAVQTVARTLRPFDLPPVAPAGACRASRSRPPSAPG